MDEPAEFVALGPAPEPCVIYPRHRPKFGPCDGGRQRGSQDAARFQEVIGEQGYGHSTQSCFGQRAPREQQARHVLRREEGPQGRGLLGRVSSSMSAVQSACLLYPRPRLKSSSSSPGSRSSPGQVTSLPGPQILC
ncbi:uncharacterized protein V5649_003630 isoform 1-T1 [Rhynchonycteris naso]